MIDSHILVYKENMVLQQRICKCEHNLCSSKSLFFLLIPPLLPLVSIFSVHCVSVKSIKFLLGIFPNYIMSI